MRGNPYSLSSERHFTEFSTSTVTSYVCESDKDLAEEIRKVVQDKSPLTRSLVETRCCAGKSSE